MDFIDDLRTLSARFAERTPHIRSEADTNNALVEPFIQMLGFDTRNPLEVRAEFTADTGKQGEKVDYAISLDGKPVVLIESKQYGTDLSQQPMAQLRRYFQSVPGVRLGILTDGVTYRFYSDLDAVNLMDERAFFEFNMLDFSDAQVRELARFTRATFNLGEIVDAARDLKYTTEIKRTLAEEFANPSYDLVRLLVRRVSRSRITPAAIRDPFTALTKQALTQFISDRVSERLKSALERDAATVALPAESPDTEEVPEFNLSETEGVNIIRAVLASHIDTQRVGMNRNKRYSSIMLHEDASHSDWGYLLCRLHFRNEDSLRLQVPANGARVQITSVNALYDYAGQLRAVVEEAEKSADG